MSSPTIRRERERSKSPAVRRFLLLIVLALPLLADQKITVRGEIADTYCLAARGIRGPQHTACAVRCARKGIPLAVVEEGTRRIYMLLPPKDKSSMPEDVIRAAGTVRSVTGRMFVNSGTRFIAVESIR